MNVQQGAAAKRPPTRAWHCVNLPPASQRTLYHAAKTLCPATEPKRFPHTALPAPAKPKVAPGCITCVRCKHSTDSLPLHPLGPLPT